MRDFNQETIKDMLENPRESIIKDWETFYQKQMNSLGQQANSGEPFAQNYLSDLSKIDYKVNQLIENHKVLSDVDYINKTDSIDELIKLAKETNSPTILDSLYQKSISYDYGDDFDKYCNLITLKESIAANKNIDKNTISSFVEQYCKRGGYTYNNLEDTIVENLLNNPSLSSNQFNSLNKVYQKEKSYFEQEELERDRNEAKASDMDYLAAKFEEHNNDLDMLDFADKALDKSNTKEIEKSKSKQHYHNH